MTLKLRGSSQVKNDTVNLSKIVNVSPGTILGRADSESEAGSMTSLSGENVRIIAGLHTTDNVHFADIEADVVSAASASLSGNLTAVDTNLSGDLNATGEVGGATATITGAASAGSLSLSGALTSSSTAALDGLSLIHI